MIHQTWKTRPAWNTQSLPLKQNNYPSSIFRQTKQSKHKPNQTKQNKTKNNQTKQKKNLSAHNWQNWKRVFLSCYFQYTVVVVVGLKITIMLRKLRFLWLNEIWGNFQKNHYFGNNFLIWSSNLKILFQTCYSLWLFSAQQILFPQNLFLVKYKVPFQILRFPEQNRLALLKDWSLKRKCF